jgi:predicted SAM-dependent methyltransferase
MSIARQTAKTLIGSVNRPLARARLRRALRTASLPLKVEVGAYRTQRGGWLGTDVSWCARHYMDAARSWPLPDSSASHVYADNVIEHLRMEPNRVLLREAHRVLAPGGRIRLATPDVEYLAQLYLKKGEEINSHLKLLREKKHVVHHPVDVLRVVFQECGHHLGYLWDFSSLSAELAAAGFTDVTRFEPGESDDADFQGLEARNDFALIVEARIAH